MATFALVGCTPSSTSETGPAVLMCRSSQGFGSAWERASREADLALILNPDYGLLHPDEELRPGDLGLGDERWSQNPTRWLERLKREITALRMLEERHRWLILAEGEWAEAVAQALQEGGHQVERSTVPMASEG